MMNSGGSPARGRLDGEILARLSHELRTPLNSVIGFSRVLTSNRAGNQSAKDLAMLECIRASGERLLDLVEDLFDATLPAPERPPVLVPVNVAAAAEAAIRQSAGMATARGIRLEVVVESTAGVLVELDAARLLRILRKLVGNAVKFTVRGEVVVTVQGDPRSGRPTALVVRDTGIGIPAALHSSIFEPFVQGEIGSRRSHEGAGLGLFVARSLAESMGCRLTMESEAGVGSRFILGLPS
jgi:signal transduction histidine kinase